MAAELRFERRGDYDNSRKKDALVFSVNDKRLAIFASHNPGFVGVAADGLCYEVSGADLFALFADHKRVQASEGEPRHAP